MKSFYSKKLLVASILLTCVSIHSMEEFPKPLSWKQLTLETLRKIDYEILSKDDQLNYRLRFAELIESSNLGVDDLVSSRLRLAELNAGTTINLAREPHAPAPSPASSGSESSSPGSSEISGIARSLSAHTDPIISDNSKPTYDFQDVNLDVLEALNPDLLSPRSRIKWDERIKFLKNVDQAPGSLGPDASSPRAALQPVPQLASPMPVAQSFEIDPMPRAHSTTPDLMPPAHSSSMPAVAENPIFSDVETKSLESPAIIPSMKAGAVISKKKKIFIVWQFFS